MGINPIILKDAVLSKMNPAERKRLGKAGRTRAEITDKQNRDTEKTIHNQWLGFCFSHNIYCTHAAMDRKSTIKKGHLDFECSKNNRVMFIEFKVPPRGLTREQEQEIDRLRACGNTAAYVIEERVQGAAMRLAIELATQFFQLGVTR
jgi:hypothetical protein